MNHFGFLFSELWRYSRASHSPENRLNAIVFECIRNVVGGIFCHNDWLKRWRCQNVFCYLQLQFPIDKIYSFVYSFTKSILFSHRKFIKHLPTIYQIIDGHRSQILYWQIWKTWILQRQLEESSRDQIPQLRLILSHLVMDASKFFSPNIWLSMIHLERKWSGTFSGISGLTLTFARWSTSIWARIIPTKNWAIWISGVQNVKTNLCQLIKQYSFNLKSVSRDTRLCVKNQQ